MTEVERNREIGVKRSARVTKRISNGDIFEGFLLI